MYQMHIVHVHACDVCSYTLLHVAHVEEPGFHTEGGLEFSPPPPSLNSPLEMCIVSYSNLKICIVSYSCMTLWQCPHKLLPHPIILYETLLPIPPFTSPTTTPNHPLQSPGNPSNVNS